MVIKIYRPTEKFPEGGIMTMWMETLKVNLKKNQITFKTLI